MNICAVIGPSRRVIDRNDSSDDSSDESMTHPWTHPMSPCLCGSHLVTQRLYYDPDTGHHAPGSYRLTCSNYKCGRWRDGKPHWHDNRRAKRQEIRAKPRKPVVANLVPTSFNPAHLAHLLGEIR